MQHKCHCFGIYQTNCYVIKTKQGELIIDPGENSLEWILDEAKNPLAILITHGHFDHIFGLAKLHNAFPLIPIYCPKDDSFMLEKDCFDTGLEPCKANILVECNKGRSDFAINDITFSYFHFPGHTPGCSIILIDEKIYSGDFVFRRSIGRYDFPYSNIEDMRDSLVRFSALTLPNCEIFPGHGESTWLKEEQENVKLWAQRI